MKTDYLIDQFSKKFKENEEPIYTKTQVERIMEQTKLKPIAYYKAFRDMTGSLTAGVLLSQLYYWSDKGKSKDFYKTDKEIMEETGITENELRSAKKKIKGLEFVKVTKRGIPCKTYYEIDYLGLADKLVSMDNWK
jgi:hypothetical protein